MAAYSFLKGFPKCNELLPVADVEETYAFHQFVELRIEEDGEPREIGIPVDVANPGYLKALRAAGLDGPTLMAEIRRDVSPFVGAWPDPVDSGPNLPERVEIADVARVLSAGEVAVGDKRYALAGLGDVADDLKAGRSVRGTFLDNMGRPAELELVPLVNSKCDLPQRIRFTPQDLTALTPSRGVVVEGLGTLKVDLSDDDREAALRDGYVTARAQFPDSTDDVDILLEVSGPLVRRSAMVPADADGRVEAGMALSRQRVGATEARQTLNRRILLHVPIEQVWRLKGYARGMLVNTFSLAPQEQMTLEVFSWDRRKTASESTSTFDQESSSESIATQKVTREALREAKDTNGWTFGANLSVSVPQVGMSMGTNFSLSNQSETTRRNTVQSVNEATEKAASRIKSSVQTKVSEAAEFGREDRSTRRITNPNTGRILNFDAFEVLAGFDVTTRYRFDRAVPCVLYPCVDFLASLADPDTRVRCHALLSLEGMIYDLVPPRIRSGFDAARTFLAWDRICQYSCDATCVCDTPKAEGSSLPAASGNPHEADVIAALGQVRDVITRLNAASGVPLSRRVGIPAVTPGYLQADSQTQSDLRRDWQAYLFRQVVMERVASPFWYICNDFVRQSENSLDWAGQLVRASSPQVSNVLNGAVAYGSLGTQVTAFLAEQVVKFGANLPFMIPYAGFDSLGFEPAFQRLSSAFENWQETEEARREPPPPATGGEAPKTEGPAPRPRRSDLGDYTPEALAKASVNVDALAAYLTLNKALFRSAIWNALNPTDRMRFLGIFGRNISFATPRVLDFIGDEIAVEMNVAEIPGGTEFLEAIRKTENAAATAEVTLPVPGVTLQARLDGCDLLEQYLQQSRDADLRRQTAIAKQAELEAKRYSERLGAKLLDDPVDRRPQIEIAQTQPSPP